MKLSESFLQDKRTNLTPTCPTDPFLRENKLHYRISSIALLFVIIFRHKLSSARSWYCRLAARLPGELQSDVP